MFEIGQKVKWSSQSMGTIKEKIGTIVEIVPKNMGPYFEHLRKKYKAIVVYGGGSGRNHESYIVLVTRGQKAKPKLYWPRVSALTVIHEETK